MKESVISVKPSHPLVPPPLLLPAPLPPPATQFPDFSLSTIF